MNTYGKRKASGMCVMCGIDPAIPGATRCVSCADKHNQTMRDRRRNLAIIHRCTECGVKHPEGYALKQCKDCLKRSELKQKRRQASKDVT